MTDQYAVIGNPIAHSKSPAIHAAFAAQTGQDLHYGRILGDLDDFAANVRDFFAAGGRGLSVTVPFKEQAWELADHLSSRAAAAGGRCGFATGNHSGPDRDLRLVCAVG